MRDEFIAYLPRTFSFGYASGTAETSITNYEACDAPASSTEAIVFELVRMFAEEILIDEANSAEDSYGEDIEVVSNCDDIQFVSPSPISNTMAVSSAELMNKFRKLVLSSMDDFLDNVVHASS